MFTLAIVGRPNVGKSTLFNRLARRQLAIVDDRAGVTRDWREADGWLLDEKIRIIDTAGLEECFDESLRGHMRRQTESALKESDAVLFVVDGRAGITPMDAHFANWLRRQDKPVILAVNKCENENVVHSALAEACGLGLGDPLPLSAAHGHGIADLYHAFLPFFTAHANPALADQDDGSDILPEDTDSLEGDESFDFAALADETAGQPIRVTIAGRPNAGKSTLLNAIVRQDRVITGAEAGTTRDSITVRWTYDGRPFALVDTAGLRRRAKITDVLEKKATDDTLRAVRLAQIVILVVDATSPIEKQDLHIASHVIAEGRGLVLAVNKWDLIQNKKETLKDIEYKIEKSLGQLKDIPCIPLSAVKGHNIGQILRKVCDIYDSWNARLSTGKLNRWLHGRTQQHPPPLVQGRPNKIRYITQVKTRPPTFAVWVSRPDDLPESYRRYLMNALREDFNLQGVTIRLLVRTSKNPYV